jgi:mannose-6-phosphate isomerase-like protein (cupin superfamily)
MQRFPALFLLVCSACAAGAEKAASPAVFDALLAGERVRIELSALPQRAQLAPGESFVVNELGRDAHTSHHVVAIRDRETPHRHDRHDLWVMMLRGHGTWRVGDAVHPVGEGSILYVPRGTVHAFANESGEPAIAYAVYTPAFDGKDRKEADESADAQRGEAERSRRDRVEPR